MSDLLVGRLEVIKDILKIDSNIATPSRHRLLIEDFQSLQAILSHPLRFVLHFRNLVDDLRIDTFASFKNGDAFRSEVILVYFANSIVAN